MADTVERETRRAVETVSALTERMSGDASHMAISARTVSENSRIAASKELTVSIHKIASQVSSARKATRAAVKSWTQAEAPSLP